MLDLWVPTGVESGAIAALSAGKLPANGSNQLPELPIFWCFFCFFQGTGSHVTAGSPRYADFHLENMQY